MFQTTASEKPDDQLLRVAGGKKFDANHSATLMTVVCHAT
jgi:hypothetical protein